MIIKESKVHILDNSGIFMGKCIQIYGGSKNYWGTLGDFVLISACKGHYKGKLATKLYLGILVSVSKNVVRNSGNIIKFDQNAVLLYREKNKENLIATKIFGPLCLNLSNKYLINLPLIMKYSL